MKKKVLFCSLLDKGQVKRPLDQKFEKYMMYHYDAINSSMQKYVSLFLSYSKKPFLRGTIITIILPSIQLKVFL